MRLSAAIQHIQHIASLGLPQRVAVPEMVDALQHVIPSSTNCFLWLGEDGTPVDMYEKHAIPEAADAFMSQTALLEATGQPSMAKLIRGRGEYGNWWQFTAFDGWDRSVMKNELFRPYNIGNNMDFPLRDRGRPVALLTVNREPTSAAFRRTEIEAMLSLRAHFVHAMQVPDLPSPAGELLADAEDATLMVDAQGRIICMGPDAGYYLFQLSQRALPLRVSMDKVPPSVMKVIDRLNLISSGQRSVPATEDIPTPWCMMRVTAHPMNAGSTIILTMQRQVPMNVRRLRNLARAPLSPGERRIAFQLCSELDPPAIAANAGLTVASVHEYSKRIRQKLGVASRDGVRARASA